MYGLPSYFQQVLSLMLYTHEGCPTHIKKAPSQASVDIPTSFKEVLKAAAKSPSRDNDNDSDSMFSDSSSSTTSDAGLSVPEESSDIFDEVDEKTKLMFKVSHSVLIYEPVHTKTYNNTCVTSKDPDQPVHPPSMARVLVYPSLDSPEAVEGPCNQQRL